jgi:nicotinate-nucleotide pyrophosphorylase (carboxylating)
VKFPFRVELSEKAVRAFVRNALREDLGGGDTTTDATVGPRVRTEARLRLKEHGVIAGTSVFEAVFTTFDPTARVVWNAREGRIYRPGRILATIRGRARTILTCERVALNLIQRLSGVATVTRRFVSEVKGTGVRIVDTRKTTPGLRYLEKYAVLVGGGHNHRPTLSDLALIKDNHIKAAGGIREAVSAVRGSGAKVLIEVEIGPDSDFEGLDDLHVDMVMLDNWPISRLGRAIRTVRGMPSRPLVEVSGGIHLNNVRKVALCGPDFISVGYLTHSAPSIDISLDF